MKILRIIESFYPYMSGPANQAYQISKRIQSNTVYSPIYTTNYKAKKSPNKEDFEGVEVTRFNFNHKFMKYIYSPNMKNNIINFNSDIIHTHNFRSYQTEIAFKCAKTKKVPFVLNTHGGLIGYKTITKGIMQLPYEVYDFFIGKKIIKETDAIIVSSKQEYDEALSFGVKKDKLHIIPMGINIDDYQSIKDTRKPNEKKKIRILFVGRICKDRNLMPILKAFNKLNDDDFEFRVVGGEVKRSDTDKLGYLDKLKNYVKENQLNVTFTGAKYKQDLIQEYRNADIFIYTSVWENFGQTLLEAGAAGLPIICTPVGVGLEIVKNNETGFIVGKNNKDLVSEIVESIKNLKDEKIRKKYSKDILNIINSDFNWNEIIKKYKNLYLELLKSK